jgi:hypothetical protein
VFQAVLNVHSARGAGDFSRLFDPDCTEPVAFGSSSLRGVDLRQQEGQFEIGAELFDAPDRMVGRLKYRSAQLSREQALDLASAFQRLLQRAAADPRTCIGDFPRTAGQAEVHETERDRLVL